MKWTDHRSQSHYKLKIGLPIDNGGPVSQPKLVQAMREVHTNEPSTVMRVKHFGPGGKEAMLRAIAYSKAGEVRKRK